MIARLISLLTAAWLLTPTGLVAQQAPVVVELFTSQGCSSCPPADKLMHDLAARDDVIALALHVDYWDYIGWKDQYADPANTRRQHAYAHEGGRKMVYTPQMIVNGQRDIVGTRSMELADLIAEERDRPLPATLKATRTGGTLRVEATGTGPVEPCDVYLVRYDPERSIAITRGENAGRTLSYYNVVDNWQVIGRWDGRGPLRIDTQLTGDLPSVVLLQRPGPGRIMAAARVQ